MIDERRQQLLDEHLHLCPACSHRSSLSDDSPTEVIARLRRQVCRLAQAENPANVAGWVSSGFDALPGRIAFEAAREFFASG